MMQVHTGESNRPMGNEMNAQSRQRKVLFWAWLILWVAGVFLVNVVALQLGERFGLSLDLTANAAYKIGEETKAVLRNLQKDVHMYVLGTPDRFQGSAYLVQAQRIMDQYPRYSNRVRLTYVDYVLDPTFTSRYPNLSLSQGDILVECGDRVKQVRLADLFNYTYTPTGVLAVESSRAEEALTSAILYVTSDDHVRVAILKGNGTADKPAFTSLLTDNNYEVAEVNLSLDELDSSYDLAVLLAPQVDLSEEAIRKLDAFLDNNGAYGKTLLYTADVTQPPLPNLEMFLKEWGVIVGDGAVFETTASRTYRYQPYYPAAEYVNATYRDKLRDPSSPVLMPLARPLELAFKARDRITNEVLLQFSATSAVRPSDAGQDFSPSQAKQRGPFPSLVLSSKHLYSNTGFTQARSNLVVSASSAMLDEFSIQNTSLSNSEYLIKMLNDLCERKDVVSIPPKSLAGKALSISTAQANVLGVLLAAVLPLAILAAGIVIWLVRRYQ